VAERTEGSINPGYYGLQAIKKGDFVLSADAGILSVVTQRRDDVAVLKGLFDIAQLRGPILITTLDLAKGVTGTDHVDTMGHKIHTGDLLFNPDTGALMRSKQDVMPPTTGVPMKMLVTVVGIGNVFGGGASYTAQSPLDITNDVISIDLTGYVQASDVPSRLWIGDTMPYASEGAAGSMMRTYWPGATDPVVGDFCLNTKYVTLVRVTTLTEYVISTVGVMDWSAFRSLLLTTDIDAAAGASRSGTVDLGGHPINAGAAVINTSTGNLMRVTDTVRPMPGQSSATVSVTGVSCVLNEKIADLAEEEF
jgi:hypothetical protein